jgi:nitroreductase
MTSMDLGIVDKLLTTTRSVRRRLDLTRAVDPALIEQCLEIAVQEPTGSNLCRHRFIGVTDAGKRETLRAFIDARYLQERLAARRQTEPRDVPSWTALAEHFQDVPTLIISCVEGRPEGLKPERLTGLTRRA